ncbi:hypothetical protein PQH03_19550 [Ralstonia insidiosa]|jgi:hypothetical protein|uniref:hypothetical protein n=1 Tax=Ralstonia TaxID=48736 RepID=UPI0010F7A1A1|nr:hypothetical protein [Ralstonia insidiosa]MBX3771357.1 hypothetical protein [Ralstonia pickettii]NOZ19177.1 hypothetical protein [Betaproteobacteria bacterium]MBC9964021.1 hypothetical protein [Ralstonia insidiosa]MBX3810132.1 hypothetical protein [Ralstonia pickettii]MBX3816005.1 hypothetical protein [Ralstonia insidiosa]
MPEDASGSGTASSGCGNLSVPLQGEETPRHITPAKHVCERAAVMFLLAGLRATAIVSSADTSNIRRPSGTGPCRSDMTITPPARTNPATADIAAFRSASSRCIQTAVHVDRFTFYRLLPS